MTDEEIKKSKKQEITDAEDATQESNETKKQESAEEYLNNWKRAVADFENLKKQAAREKDEFAKFATFRAAEAFMPAVDHFAEALRHEPTPENWQNWVQGVKFINQEFAGALIELGIEKIKTVGVVFDPSMHESIGVRHEDGKEAHVILEERRAGYKMQGKVLRPARVIINE
ncbi:MAG: nucleotide exchange factor GrpE [bacterium]